MRAAYFFLFCLISEMGFLEAEEEEEGREEEEEEEEGREEEEEEEDGREEGRAALMVAAHSPRSTKQVLFSKLVQVFHEIWENWENWETNLRRDMRSVHPSRPLLDPQLVFARWCVERKRVVGPTEAWTCASYSYRRHITS
jgi:hypothetical protein